VQAPQLVVSQPMWVPVSPSVSRMKWTSNRRGSTSACRTSPLTVTVIGTVRVLVLMDHLSSRYAAAAPARSRARRSARAVTVRVTARL